MHSNHRSTPQVLDYEECGTCVDEVWQGFNDADSSIQTESGIAPKPERSREDEFAEELRKSFDAGRAHGFEDGQRAEREAHAASREAEDALRRDQITAVLRRFSDEREQYFQSVEHEVASLALAVAARILRRESQLDPLLLTGAVRVALGQLSGSTEVVLRVPPAELDLWQESIAHLPNLKVRPSVEPGEGLRIGDCAIHTSVGTVDLGIRTQLSEIERGFFDQVGRTHGTNSSDAPSRAEAEQ